ncbi:hypothetical protein BaRGS_00030804 [Batillaria attramentaria]|uniref:Uncharacterized protein n=1 Tax=Batillaria attramentaria TaxID=370345 RepID=A0ABD0JTH4_9CAEN
MVNAASVTAWVAAEHGDRRREVSRKRTQPAIYAIRPRTRRKLQLSVCENKRGSLLVLSDNHTETPAIG